MNSKHFRGPERLLPAAPVHLAYFRVRKSLDLTSQERMEMMRSEELLELVKLTRRCRQVAQHSEH